MLHVKKGKCNSFYFDMAVLFITKLNFKTYANSGRHSLLDFLFGTFLHFFRTFNSMFELNEKKKHFTGERTETEHSTYKKMVFCGLKLYAFFLISYFKS